ncbi:hypothetical protein COB21_06025 [Candidatus Aerophobetes bacterium]|uniref:Uncharacterized protein n=1 Tax=Aerophobetes bacterium TaxID=2030807 RepID=A0A2A4WY10_UNCAE|nr:MAG: hypothetical protein COB21_06025 [Candidatus Aerophobetes bacterium]
MKNKEDIALSSILKTLEPKKSEHLKKFLSDDEQQRLKEVAAMPVSFFDMGETPKERVDAIHYSWFIPFVEPFCDSDKALILASFENEDREKLHTHFQIKEHDISLSKQAKQFLHLTLFTWITENQRLYIPKASLVDSPLLNLLSLSKKQIIYLVDLLSMHDLSIEIKHIVSSSLLSNITLHLLSHQKDYLKQILKTKEPINFPKLQLDQWDGNKESLRTILYHRGFNRLSKALYGEQKALFWHVTHKIDTGRAKVMEKFYSDVHNAQIHQHLLNQVVSIAKKIAG